MDKKNPLVSVLMNCFNGERYLDEALKCNKPNLYKLGINLLG